MGARLRAGGGVEDNGRTEVSRLVGKKRTDWAAIQAEYIGGNIGQQRLAKKYGIAYGSLRRRAESEGWYQLKKQAVRECGLKAAQKTAEAASDNAVIAARIKLRLLEQLEALVVENRLNATEEREYDFDGNLTEINRLRDLTAAYKDLTGDLLKDDSAKTDKVTVILDV